MDGLTRCTVRVALGKYRCELAHMICEKSDSNNNVEYKQACSDIIGMLVDTGDWIDKNADNLL